MKKLFCSLVSVLIFTLTLSSIQTTYAIGGLSEFTQTNTDYFGDSNNSNTDDMIVYNDKIYISLWNDDTKVEVWEYNGTTWTQSNVNGFLGGKIISTNYGTDNFIIHNSKLYVGTTGNAHGVEVWEYNGTTWSQVNIDGFGDARNTRVNNDMVIHNSELYAAATNNDEGVEIWKYNDVGTSWTMVSTNGFGNTDNLSVYNMSVYNSKLYVGTYQNGGATEIWTCTTCDGSDWTQTSTDGFGDANNTRIHEFIVYGSKLYVPTYNTSTGTEIWELDVASWSQVNTDGFGDANNDSIINSFLYDGNLYFGTSNWTTGTEVWQYDGTTFTQINTNGFGDANNADFTSSVEYAGNLYGGVYNDVTGVEIWRYNDTGTSWTQVNENGFGEEFNIDITPNMALLGDSIHVASGTASTVPRTWETHTASTDLALTKTIDNALPEVGETATYTLTLTNSGPDGATSVEVTDLLPAGLTYTSDTPSQGTYTSGTGVWDVGSVSNGNSATLTISATVTASAGETVSNSAEITAAAEADPDSTVNNDDSSEDDQASVDFTVSSIDLALTKTVDTPYPSTGSPIAYTLILTNNGPDTATNIQVTDTLSSDTSYLSSSPPGAYNGDTGVWTVGTLANGGQASLTINATVTATTAGTIITNSAEVTSVTGTDSDSTPNNDDSSEDDQASAQSQLADPAVGGTSSFISSGGSSKKTTVETLSGEEEEPEAEEPEEKPEEEPKEEPIEEPTEEKLEEEKNILKEATKTVTTTVIEKIYTAPPTPAPAPPAPPAPAPPALITSEDLLDTKTVSDAIEQYLQEPTPELKELSPSTPEAVKENVINSTNKIFVEGKSVSVFVDGEKKIVNDQAELETILEKVDLTKSDLDGDRLLDVFATKYGFSLFEIDPDGDSNSNEKEIYCGSDPFEADELQPKVSNLDGVTSGSVPAFRLCAGTPGDNYEIYLMDQKTYLMNQETDKTDEQTLLGVITIGEDNRGIFVSETEIPDGSYYILAKKIDGEEIYVSSFVVSNSDVPAPPEIQLTNKDNLNLGPIVRIVIEFNDKISAFDSEKFIASASLKINGDTQNYIKGTSEPGLVVYATWQSRTLGSVVVADASAGEFKGEFKLEIPTELPPGEHEIWVYGKDEENNLVSSVTSFIFTK